jgi:hypothetical protein
MIDFLGDREPESPWFQFAADNELRAAWAEVGGEILDAWIATAPGTRPSAWWKYDAPRQPLGVFPECHYDGKLPEPRERLGGVGTPDFEALSYVPSYSYGIPNSWLTQEEVAYYQPDFDGIAIDPEDPPQYESQAVYLRRLDLFLPGESKRLRKADFEPELVMPEDDEEAEDAA